MTNTQRTETAGSTADVDGGRKPPAGGPAFKIRYGRLTLALAGVLSLLTGVVSAALLIFGLGSAWLPVAAFLGAVAAVVLLRRLAVRDRRRKVSIAFRAAMGTTARSSSAQSASARSASGQSASARSASGQSASAQSAPERNNVVRPSDAGGPAKRAESPLFDAQSVTAAPKAAPKPLTAQELRQAALAEAAASGDTSVRAATGPALPATEGSSWEPVEVPRPTYVEAPKAERAAPEPLDLPEAPKAVGKPSLKQGLSQGTARQLASETQAAGDSEAKPLGKAQSALSNLDDVLQRRRA